ncbi:MAG: CHASE2 domain-containing protein, partial [Alphaproteobacteria bacterium]
MNFQRLRNSLVSLIAGLVIAVLAFALPRQVEPFENLIYDAMVRNTAEPFAGSGVITLIDVDEQSLAKVGQWPWPRSHLAALVEQVNAGQPLALVFDAIFPERDRLSPDLYADTLSDTAGISIDPSVALPSFDQQFADRIAAAPVVLGQNTLLADGARGFLATQSETFQRRPTINLMASDRDLIADGFPPTAYRLPALLSNIPVLDEAASGLGVVALPADTDGIARAIPLIFVHEGRTLPSLSLETLRVALSSRGQLVRIDEGGIREVVVQGRLGRVIMPTDRRGRLWIRFPRLAEGQQRYFRVVPAADVLRDDFDASVFTNQIVIFGSSAAGLFDLKSTPLGSQSNVPGMDLQALTVHQALTGEMVIVEEALQWELLAAALFFLYVLVLAPRLPGLINSAVLVVLLSVTAGVQVWMLSAHDTYLSLFGLFVFLLGYGGVSLVGELIGRDRQRREIKSAFSQYLSPALVTRISRAPGLLKLG